MPQPNMTEVDSPITDYSDAVNSTKKPKRSIRAKAKTSNEDDFQRTNSRRRSPRKNERASSMNQEPDDEIVPQELPSKPVLKLYLRSNDSFEKLVNEDIESGSKNREPTLLRLRLGSSSTQDKNKESSNLIAKRKLKSVPKSDTLSEAFEDVRDGLEKRSLPTTSKKSKISKIKSSKENHDRTNSSSDNSRDSNVLDSPQQEDYDEEETEITSQLVNSSVEIINEDFCTACGLSGYFICCETCPKSFHLTCIYPPISLVPEENWQCTECKTKMKVNINAELKTAINARSNTIDSYQRLWESIWSDVVCNDPAAFTLPKRLRSKKDVSVGCFFEEDEAEGNNHQTGTDGSKKLSNGSSKPSKKSQSLKQTPVLPSSTIQFNERISTTGNCHHCGHRSVIPDLLPLRVEPLIPQPLIKCDKCPLLWHPDCVDPPLTLIPPADGKWICPAHVNLPIHPNFIPEVVFDNQGDPFEYEIASRPLGPIPRHKPILPEQAILLDFGIKVRKLRTSQAVPPPAVQDSYRALDKVHSKVKKLLKK